MLAIIVLLLSLLLISWFPNCTIKMEMAKLFWHFNISIIFGMVLTYPKIQTKWKLIQPQGRQKENSSRWYNEDGNTLTHKWIDNNNMWYFRKQKKVAD